VKVGLLSCILLAMAAASAQTVAHRDRAALHPLAADPRVVRALEWLTNNVGWVTDEQIRITEIPAPPFHEASRAAYSRKLLAGAGLHVRIDELGNVIGERPGAQANEVVMLVAHLDTVFPAGTDVHVRREGWRLLAPGISDNGTGLAALVAVGRALHESKLKTQRTILFVADVGEEGEGNLRGMRKLVEAYRSRLRYVIALDGSTTDHVTTSALASRRIEVAVTGPGGHSWSDFGMPNPIHALSRGIVRFLKVRVPADPRTAYNIGEIEGGTSVNSIPSRAGIKVDLRSESETELDRLEAALHEAVQAGVDGEMSASRERGASSRGANAKLEVKFGVLGVRPGGQLPENSPLLAALHDADRFVGNRSREERSSTDANIPLSLGIQAISIGAGGNAGGAHSLSEWYDPSGREMGLQRVLLTLLGVAGVEPLPKK
jgi:acetylornithine deacetylase/succinyl-diaminopimelate desuccinylase-like protein